MHLLALSSMDICRKRNLSRQNLFSPAGCHQTRSDATWNLAFAARCLLMFALLPLRPQVFKERSLSQGGGDLPLRHRHWPLCESHRSPGQHCCISTQCPGGSAYHRCSHRFVTPITAGRVYEQSPSAASPGHMQYHVISAGSKRLVL